MNNPVEVRRRLPRALLGALAAGCVIGVVSCSSEKTPTSSPQQTATLRIGFGLVNGQDTQSGMRQAANLIEKESLIVPARDGRLEPSLADRWNVSADGLTWRLHLRENAFFHSGRAVTAEAVGRFLNERLRSYLGAPADDIESISAISSHDLQISLKRPSTLILEGLDISIEEPESRGGTGPYVSSGGNGSIELRANPQYHDGPPNIERLSLRSYDSTRAAWADLLRGELDMVYEVGPDALDSLQPSTSVRVISRPRNYAYVVLLNQRRPQLTSGTLRRAMNAAIDRAALVAEGLYGHGRPTNSPVWPLHWALDPSAPGFDYRPEKLAAPVTLTCLFADASLERLALGVQRQLAAIGVDLKLELLPLDVWYQRANSGDFDAILADALQGPTFFWPSQFWRSGASYNWGAYKNPSVDHALDAIKSARDDNQYRAGVSAFQRAIVADPPAIFLAWSERARVVSTRFDVVGPADRDIWNTLRLWKPNPPHN